MNDRQSIVALPLSRRPFSPAIAAGASPVAWPMGSFGAAPHRRALATPRYLDDHELATLEALCDRSIPPDADPGARQLVATRYVERLLITFDGDAPFLLTVGRRMVANA